MNKKALKIMNNILMIVFIIFSVMLAVYYSVHFNAYYLFLSVASFVIPFIPNVIYRVFRLTPAYTLTMAARVFIFLAFHIGMACKGYVLIPFYDKIVHTFSGVIFSVLGIIIFYALKHGHTIDKKDSWLCTVFSFSFSMMIAAVWEIYEYIIGFVLKTDPQCVAATGVGDTMSDIIACLVGTAVLCLLIIYRFKTEKSGALLTAVSELYK